MHRILGSWIVKVIGGILLVICGWDLACSFGDLLQFTLTGQFMIPVLCFYFTAGLYLVLKGE